MDPHRRPPASTERPAWPPLFRPQTDDRGHHLPIPNRYRLARSARSLRQMTDRVDLAPPPGCRWHLGHHPLRTDCPRSEEQQSRLRHLGRLDNRSRSPTRDEHQARKKGTRRTTRIWPPSCLTTPSAAPAGACRQRLISSSSVTGGHWCRSVPPARTATVPCLLLCWST